MCTIWNSIELTWYYMLNDVELAGVRLFRCFPWTNRWGVADCRLEWESVRNRGDRCGLRAAGSLWTGGTPTARLPFQNNHSLNTATWIPGKASLELLKSFLSLFFNWSRVDLQCVLISAVQKNESVIHIYI